MRRFGLVLSIFLMIAALGSMWAASRLILVRSSWQKKYADAKTSAVEKRKLTAKAEKEADQAKNDLQRVIHGWERYWPGVNVNPGGRPGTLGLIQFGTNQGLLQDKVVYVFQPSPDGQGMAYVGPFKVTAAQGDQALLTANWRFRPGDDANWRYGPNWHIRTNIPQPHVLRFSSLELNLLVKDESLTLEQKNLAAQKTDKASAESHRDVRIKELKGDPDLQQQTSLDRYLIVGLEQAVAETEAERNAIQQQVDQLRRDVKRTNDLIQKTTADNEQLAKQLSGETERTASKVP